MISLIINDFKKHIHINLLEERGKDLSRLLDLALKAFQVKEEKSIPESLMALATTVCKTDTFAVKVYSQHKDYFIDFISDDGELLIQSHNLDVFIELVQAISKLAKAIQY